MDDQNWTYEPVFAIVNRKSGITLASIADEVVAAEVVAHLNENPTNQAIGEEPGYHEE